MKESNLDKKFWDNRYLSEDTGWDIGHVSTPIKGYIDQLEGKNISILLPGCGNAYEAAYLLENGFTNITLVDISPSLVQILRQKFAADEEKGLKIICADFFEISGTFDLVIEQTFFCAIDPSLRKKYAGKMHSLLKYSGKLAGVFFNRNFDGGPPFGGNEKEYREIFSSKFNIQTMETCYNSISARAGTELFIVLSKKSG